VAPIPRPRRQRGGAIAEVNLSHRGRGASTATGDRTDQDAVEVRVFWGDSLLGSMVKVRPTQITVGEDAGADFIIPGAGLPGPRFAIVTGQGDAITLRFLKSMEGEFQPANQTPIRFADLIARGQASAQDGAYALALPSGSFAWASVGNLTFEVEVTRVPRRTVAPFWEGLDLRFVNIALLMCFGILAFIISAATFPLDTDTTADDLFRNPHALAKFVVKPPETIKNAFLDKLQKDANKGREKNEQAEKHAGAEGKAGKKNAPQKNAKAAPKAVDLNAKEIVKNSALLKALGQGGGLSTILGQGGLGGTLNGALGHLTGAASGDANGLGGLGLRGGGLGGGGFGNTIGIGDIGTRGRGGGLNGYGSSVGTLGKKTSSEVAISSGNPVVEGSMDKELIRRVIHEHRNQVRYCYESELQRHPGLNGKVTVKFVIGPAGQVQKSGVDTSSLGNPAVENCIVARVYQWQFPKPKGGGIVQVSYPFLLKESGD
jgi:TonB family protein